MTSFNKAIVKAYNTDGALKSKQMAVGLVGVEQKTTLVGLELLTEVVVMQGGQSYHFFRGDKAYIREEYLHTQPWAKKKLTAEGIEGEFIIVDLAMIEYFAKQVPAEIPF